MTVCEANVQIELGVDRREIAWPDAPTTALLKMQDLRPLTAMVAMAEEASAVDRCSRRWQVRISIPHDDRLTHRRVA